MSDKKPVKKLPLIRSREQLRIILEGLDSQGFGYYAADWKAHEKKVESLINKNNILNIKEDRYKSELTGIVNPMTNYNDIDKTIKKFFKKFKPDDKIAELLNNFYLQSDYKGKPPSHSHPDRNEIFEWVKFKKRYGITDKFKFGYSVDVYDLDKKFIKVRFFDKWSNKSNFDDLYRLIYGESPNEWSKDITGSWQDLGKVEVKIFQNDTMNIKGDTKKLKEYFYKEIRDKSAIIFYNKKKEIRESGD